MNLLYQAGSLQRQVGLPALIGGRDVRSDRWHVLATMVQPLQ